jgi:pimeloyl-ACP methyl ester carboxylesterase
LVLVAPGGLIRTRHKTIGSKLLYESGWLPEWLVRVRVASKLWTGPESRKAVETEPDSIENAETTTTAAPDDARSIRSERSSTSGKSKRKHHKKREGDRDGSPEHRHRSQSVAASDLEAGEARGHTVYLSSQHALLAGYPQSTASAVVDWQIKNHKGFVPAFISSIRNAPVYNQHHRWAIIKENIENRKGPLKEVWLVLGETDPIIVKEELVEDATDVLGDENVRLRVVEGAGHEVAIERADEIVQVVGSVLGWHRKPHSTRSTHDGEKKKKRSFF